METARAALLAVIASLAAFGPSTAAVAQPSMAAPQANGAPQQSGAAPQSAAAPDTIRTAPLVFAVEDTLGAFVAKELGEVRVESTRVPLIEMIRKAQEGERKKYEGVRTMAMNVTAKLTMKAHARSWRTRAVEQISRLYYRAPDRWAEAPIRKTRYEISPDGERKPWDEKDNSVDISVGDDDGSRGLTEPPVYLERLDKFRFRLVHRSVSAKSVLYEIAFDPISDFDALPSGRLWLVSPQYQIVREELALDHIPFPWILKSVSLLTREWQEVDGRWVEKRITARARLGLGFVPFVQIPDSVEVVATFTDYRFDLPLEDALFAGSGK